MAARDVLVSASAPGQETMGGGAFEVWVPAAPPADAPFKIIGSEFSQVLEVDVAPGMTVTAEPGTMVFMGDRLELDADVGGFGQGCMRCCCAGESFFRMHMANKTSSTQRVGISPLFPARVVPVDLAQHSGMIVNRGAFLAAIGVDWRVDLKSVGSMGACCFGGQGLFMNTLHGNGTAFLNAGGTVMQKVLQAGETIVVDQHSVLAFEKTVELGVRRTGGCFVCCCAGQGLFNATLTGPGFVMVHTMGLQKLKRAIGATQGKQGGNTAT
eukprot:CAMPEP_0194477042 /NCGR_PEP_ID=MMETSP0253-20130528/831_1 /TAXON_ID=2966 /ORGANISM="Noctiluca scintillans" /LENGTH=268 /DNA_ID=CAMNT_0039315963 /DNA_START=78 /DNA_END=884 /DNA_ORIENTATION=+